jgi:hypothetical protein
MKIKIIKRNLLLAGIFLALMGQGAMAGEGKRIFHEEKWKDTMAYGRIIISEDSAKEWGPWTEFVQPAAGGMTLAAVPQVTTDGPSYFRPESADEYSPKYTQVVGPPPVTEGFCQAGEWCGYAAYQNYSEEYDEYEEDYGPYPGRIGITLSPADGGEGNASWRLVSLFGAPNPNYGESGEMEAWWYNGLGNFDAYRETETDGGSDYAWACSGGECAWYYTPTEYVTTGWFGRGMEQYMNGDGGEGYGYWKSSETYGPFVAGITTPLTDIANLQAGNVIANYSGSTSGWGGDSSPVYITVNFGPGTWSGSWNNGSDGNTNTYTDSSGQLRVYGQVGFNAEGPINGANIQSTSVSANDGTVIGQVEGSFFGPDAGALGGVTDITKSTEGYTNAQYVDVFVTCNGGCPD